MMAATQRKSVKLGDVVEVKSSRGYSYVQYVGKHDEYGDVVRVLPGCFEEALQEFDTVIGCAGYLAFYSARRAVSQGLAQVVASFPLPAGTEVPIRVRRAGARGTSGQIHTWIIEENGREYVRQTLTELERQLPIAAIWDHELLTLRISEGWHPSQQG